jgi:hypothetical protein
MVNHNSSLGFQCGHENHTLLPENQYITHTTPTHTTHTTQTTQTTLNTQNKHDHNSTLLGPKFNQRSKSIRIESECFRLYKNTIHLHI